MANTNIEGSAQPFGTAIPTAFAGATEPPAGKRHRLWELWAAWKRIARKIGDFQARVLLTVFYFLLLAPFALIVRRTSDPLALKPATLRGWGERTQAPEYTIEMARRQF